MTVRMCNRVYQLSLALLIVIIVGVSGNQRFARSTDESCAMKFKQFPGHSACLPKSPNAVTFEMSSEDKEALVMKHNELRKIVHPQAADMLAMSWDDEVAMIAKKWTDSCKAYSKGSQSRQPGLQHDKYYHRLIPGRFSVGQNLAHNQSSFMKAIQAWFDESRHYKYPFGAKSKSFGKAGHYTQLVWAASYKLGCSRTKCGNEMIYACNYAPAGNVGNELPYKLGPKMCLSDKDGLCDCGNLECANGSPLNSSTCSCQCTPRYFLDTDCKFSCKFEDDIMCGVGFYSEVECHNGSYALSVSQNCPHLCKVCPYADPGYTDKGCSQTARFPMTWFFSLGLLLPKIATMTSMEF